MHIKYYCDTFNKITYTLWDGDVDSAQWLANLRKTIEVPAWASSEIWIIDQTTATRLSSVSIGTIGQVIALLKEHIKNVRNRKIVFISNDSYFQNSQVQAVLRQIRVEVVVFEDLSAACAHLGLELANVQREFSWLRADVREG